MKASIVYLIFFLLFSSLAQAIDSDGSLTEIYLSIGRTATLPVAHRQKISVSNGAVIHVTDLGDSVKIVGRKLGSAVLQIGNQSTEGSGRAVQITVLPEAAYRTFAVLQSALNGKRGLKISFQGETLKITGRLLRVSDWKDLAVAAAALPAKSYVFAAEIDPAIGANVDKFIRDLLASQGLPDVELQLAPRAQANVASEPADLSTRVSEVLGPYGFAVNVAASAVTLQPLVRVHILVAEVKKSMMSQMGITWPGSIDGQILPQPSIPADGNLQIKLNALEQNGWGKILASPTLLCRSGKEANFFAGGEFPIKIINYRTQDVVWKKYGVVLHIEPRADAHGRMSIAISTEISAIDAGHTVDGVPGLFVDHIDTHFDLASSRTIALSGLIKKEWSEGVSGLPGLSSIPILGPLFSSRDYRNDRSELIIFVTPELAQPLAETN